MPDNIFFSTGKLRIGSVGAVLTDADNLLNCQNIEIPIQFQEALVRTATWLSQFPTHDAQYDGSVMAKAETTSFSELVLQAVTGIAPVTGGGKRTYTGNLTSTPQYRQIEFVGQTPDGKNGRFNIPRGKIRAFAPKFGRDQFQSQPIEAQSFPGTVYAPFIFEVDV